MVKARGDNQTMDLLQWKPPQVCIDRGAEAAGKGTLDNKIARIISAALRASKRDRSDVAYDMTEFLGRRVSMEMLEKWASQAATGHRIPLDAFIALIDVTGSHQLVGFVADQFDLAVIPQQYADVIELHLIEEHEREVADRKAALQAKWRRCR